LKVYQKVYQSISKVSPGGDELKRGFAPHTPEGDASPSPQNMGALPPCPHPRRKAGRRGYGYTPRRLCRRIRPRAISCQGQPFRLSACGCGPRPAPLTAGTWGISLNDCGKDSRRETCPPDVRGRLAPALEGGRGVGANLLPSGDTFCKRLFL